jgi:hypothetical protein
VLTKHCAGQRRGKNENLPDTILVHITSFEFKHTRNSLFTFIDETYSWSERLPTFTRFFTPALKPGKNSSFKAMKNACKRRFGKKPIDIPQGHLVISLRFFIVSLDLRSYIGKQGSLKLQP